MTTPAFRRLRDLFFALRAHTVWDPDAIPSEEFKYRNLKRMWLPVFDAVVMLMGYLAFLHGSPILNRMFPGWLVDVSGIALLTASAVALVGVVTPRLYMMEIAAKVIMLSLLGTYSVIIWTSFFQGEVQSGFVAAELMLPILFPLFRLQILGEEIKQRREGE